MDAMADNSSPAIRLPVRVRYHECDPQGIVFHAHYLAYADMASFACMKALFGSLDVLRDSRVDLVVAESNVRYLAPCRFDDELVVAVFIDRVGTTSLILRFDIERETELAAAVTNRYVWIGTETLRPTAPPDQIREVFASLVRVSGVQ